MKCPLCGDPVYLREDRVCLRTREYAPKARGVGFAKKSIRKSLDAGGNGTYPYSLFCKSCDYTKTVDDELSEEEDALIDWVDENMKE